MKAETKKIFVADDDADILQIIEMMLHTEGYIVHTTPNAEEIFAFQKDQLPDLILLDIWMSGVDGRDICTRLKDTALTKSIPVFFISANSNIAEITSEYGADGFIAKPFEMDYLIRKVRSVTAPG